MRKLSLLIILMSLLLLASCSDFLYKDGVQNNDWSYPLKNGYEIVHINSEKIICGKRKDKYTTSIDIRDYITKFYYNDKIVCLQYLEEFEAVYKSNSDNEFKYAIIYFNSGETEKYKSLNEFLLGNRDKEITDIKDWTATKPRPEGAMFG